MAASSKRYLVVDDEGKGHLPVRDTPDGPLNHHLMGAAWAALHEGYRGKKYKGPGKQAAIERLKALYRSEGMELPDAKGADEQMGSGQLGETENGRSKVENGRPVSSFQLSVSDSQPSAHRPACLSACRQDVPRFMVLLAEAPAAGLIRIPIAITGAWRGAEKEFSIELDDLEEIRANFARKPTGEINVDYEHASEVPFGTGGPVLSAGRIVKLDEPEPFADGEIGRSGDRVNNSPDHPTSRSSDHPVRYILWGWYKPTERARELIQLREYRYISPAIRWGAKDKVTGRAQGTTLTSVALVNKPFLEEMPAIGGGVQPADGPVGRSANAYSATRPLPTGPPAQTGTCPPACFAETVGEQRVFVSLGQVHVPGPVNQVRGSGRGTRVPKYQMLSGSRRRARVPGFRIRALNPASRILDPCFEGRTIWQRRV